MKLLDLYCGAGGAAAGYRASGFDIVGIDIKPQPQYPFEFIQFDITKMSTGFLRKFDVVHASPPCQAASSLRALNKDIDYKDLIPFTRDLLVSSGLPYVIENVNGAELYGPLILCGTMFDKRFTRHRLFESNVSLKRLDDACKRGGVASGEYISIVSGSGKWHSYKDLRDEMEVPWMNLTASRQAIPPCYTKYIGDLIHDILVPRSGSGLVESTGG